jgi:hypothetical protein
VGESDEQDFVSALPAIDFANVTWTWTPKEVKVSVEENVGPSEAVFQVLDQLMVVPGELPKGKKPKTMVTPQIKNRYDAAQRLRVIAKQLYAPEDSITPRILKLQQLIMSRSSKKDRLEQLELITQLVNERDQLIRNGVVEIRKLVQMLPTVPDLPTTREQNVVRAIVAILKTNDMIDGGSKPDF